MTSAHAVSDSVSHERKLAQADVVSLRKRITRLDADGIDLILRTARSHHTWKPIPVTDEDLRQIHSVARWGPTSTNGNPARYVFIRTIDQKERLLKCVSEGNRPKVLAAPVICIVAYDIDWWKALGRLFAHKDMSLPYRASQTKAAETAFRNSSLQAAYFMIAARALGFDVGAMSGFDNAMVDSEFFSETTFRSNLLCTIGYADVTGLFPRLPRYSFDEVCTIL